MKHCTVKKMKQCRYRKTILCSFLSLIVITGLGRMLIKHPGTEEQLKRVSQMHKICKKYQNELEKPNYRDHLTIFFSSEKYKLSYCKIGKIASTFWTQFFYILHHDSIFAKNMLRTGREKVHNLENTNQRYGTNMSSSDEDFVIISSRNPFTRLYSAYIDRMYIPSTSKSVRRDEKCKSFITFEEFLQNVENTRKCFYDYHWSPVFYICKPCEIKPNFLFKQETFKDDISHVLKHTKLESSKRDNINKIIEEGSKWSPFALIEDVLQYIVPQNIYGPLDCQTWKNMLLRLWEVLKIQGAIADEAPFPEKLYQSQKDFENPDLFRRCVLEARRSYPMSIEKKSSQRRKALNSAYSEVDPEVIHDIQEVFSVDFEMLGYRNDPPPWETTERNDLTHSHIVTLFDASEEKRI